MDFMKVNELIETYISEHIDYCQAVSMLIDECEKIYPNDDWKQIRNINHKKIKDDFNEIFNTQINMIRGKKIKGMYFGFSEVSIDGTMDNCSYVVEMGGTTKTIQNIESQEWSYDLDWYSNIYLESNGLNDLYRIIHKENGLENNAEYPIGLCFTAVIANMIIQNNKNELNELQAAVAGFHDGDMLLIKK